LKRLDDLIQGVPYHWNQVGSLKNTISRIQCDSREVKQGDLFVAIRGVETDGHLFIHEAVRRGAAAIVCEIVDTALITPSIPQIQVDDSRQAMALLAQAFFDHPERHISMIGVTGTNGKSTSTYLIRHILNQQFKVGLLGTIMCETTLSRDSSSHTTPDSLSLYEALSKMREGGVRYCVMEVSSHGLDQERVRGIPFHSVAFLNLTPEHLDYHQNMERYYISKKKLFCLDPKPGHMIVNLNDAFGRRLKDELPPDQVLTFGTSVNCDYRATNIKAQLDQIDFKLSFQTQSFPVRVPIGLSFNVENVLCALSIVGSVGIPIKEAIKCLATFSGVPGRLEQVRKGQNFHVIVDYAHTPDAMFRVLNSIREINQNRLITIFGCGGNRDQKKRAEMGKIACRYSDKVVITSDNPRNEDPLQIMGDIVSNLTACGDLEKIFKIENREKAIHNAIGGAEKGDIVLILGKGHESFQLVGTNKIPFCDVAVSKAAIRSRKGTISASPSSLAH
jgi:UDP-N-acetylmuramoyl-L-alanyl-D-glutamate--2,6-diaminopimelate ligase